MRDPKKSSRTPKKSGLSRREFVRQVGAAGAIYWIAPADVSGASISVDRLAIVSAMGETLIPSAAGDPGFRELESHGITEEVLKGLTALSDELLEALNLSSAALFGGKSFVKLDATERERHLKAMIAGELVTDDPGTLTKLQFTYKMLRVRIFTVYYQNFPENRIPMDERGMPINPDLHQIANPNSSRLVTGWDVANYPGPMTWEEEEQLRARMKEILWQE